MSDRRKQYKRLSNTTSGLITAEAGPLDAPDRNLSDIQHISLDEMFLDTLSQRDRELSCRVFQNRELDAKDNKDSENVRRILGEFDNFILRIAPTLGCRIFSSPTVRERIDQWDNIEENGAELLEQLGKALALGARARRGLTQLPMHYGRKWYEAKKQAKVELRLLLNRVRDFSSVSGKTPSMTEIRSFVREKIEDKPESFPFLAQGLVLQSLLGFLRYLESTDLSAAGRLANGEIKPARFFDEWGAWSTTREVESFRQKIAELGSQKIAP